MHPLYYRSDALWNLETISDLSKLEIKSGTPQATLITLKFSKVNLEQDMNLQSTDLN